jgi:hypothetical protein
MADYKELLRKAVEALPENNGAARRAVYEKARAALVGQLRAINPPLPARDITTHRLQLEDCIRQVEQEASEAVIAGMGGGSSEMPPPPVYFETNGPGRAQPQIAKATVAKPAPAKPTLVPRETKALPAGGSIEDIIAAANAEAPAPEPKPKRSGNKPVQMRLASPVPKQQPEPEPEADESEPDILPPKPSAKSNGRALPSIVARAEAAKGRSNSTAFGVPGGEKPYDATRRGPQIEPRPSPRLEPAARGNQAVARQQLVEPAAFLDEPRVAAAMSAVREVDVELEPQQVDPQGAIDRAIATLDREARGEASPMVNGDDHAEVERPNGKAKGLGSLMPGARKAPAPARQQPQPKPQPPSRQTKPTGRPSRDAVPASRRNRDDEREASFPRARQERERGGGMSAVTIFLIVFAVLLTGAGGAGYWAVSQGYLDLSTMFGSSTQQQAAAPSAAAAVTADVSAPATGPGNTTAPAEAPAPTTELAGAARLTPDPALSGTEPLALAATSQPAAPAEERLVSADNAASAEAAVAAIDPANLAGSQSLLLEASPDGTTGAVPFSGTVEWSKGADETGQPTLVGKANIPARNLGVDVLIRRNGDPSLPASHLMEINFRVSDSFIGGSIAGLPGVLLKNEELVQGTPLVGASARVIGNSFLFALSASQEDLTNNTSLLTGRKWMDLALIYATGTRAIITLEKDSSAEALFNEVFATWGQTASN